MANDIELDDFPVSPTGFLNAYDFYDSFLQCEEFAKQVPTKELGQNPDYSFCKLLKEIHSAKSDNPALHSTVTPRTIQGRPAWFRVFYSVGKTYPCWWHPLTHVYAMVTQSEENRYELSSLHELTQKIASICKLDWFTTEIALTLENFVVVDYDNEEIDTRVQSRAVDGAPDEIIQNIASQLVTIAKEHQ